MSRYAYEVEAGSPVALARDHLFVSSEFYEDWRPSEPKPADELAVLERYLNTTESEDDE
jgi:hypothetical protein